MPAWNAVGLVHKLVDQSCFADSIGRGNGGSRVGKRNARVAEGSGDNVDDDGFGFDPAPVFLPPPSRAGGTTPEIWSKQTRRSLGIDLVQNGDHTAQQIPAALATTRQQRPHASEQHDRRGCKLPCRGI
jgi:hypothetical protein